MFVFCRSTRIDDTAHTTSSTQREFAFCSNEKVGGVALVGVGRSIQRLSATENDLTKISPHDLTFIFDILVGRCIFGVCKPLCEHHHRTITAFSVSNRSFYLVETISSILEGCQTENTSIGTTTNSAMSTDTATTGSGKMFPVELEASAASLPAVEEIQTEVNPRKASSSKKKSW